MREGRGLKISSVLYALVALGFLVAAVASSTNVNGISTGVIVIIGLFFVVGALRGPGPHSSGVDQR